MAPRDDIVLIGYRGAGKTTVGRRLAAKLQREFIDVDDQIEAATGTSILAIFRNGGEDVFRQLEHDAIVALAGYHGPPRVVAVGGGAVLRPANHAPLESLGRRVWLIAPAETLWSRIQNDPLTSMRRPGLVSGGDLSEVRTLLEKRTPLYRQVAQLTIDTHGRTPDQIAEQIITELHVSVETGRHA